MSAKSNIILLVFALSGTFARAQNATYEMPSGKLLYCADKNVYEVVSKRIELFKRDYPKCKITDEAQMPESGGLILTLGSGEYYCSRAHIHIQPAAGCAF